MFALDRFPRRANCFESHIALPREHLFGLQETREHEMRVRLMAPQELAIVEPVCAEPPRIVTLLVDRQRLLESVRRVDGPARFIKALGSHGPELPEMAARRGPSRCALQRGLPLLHGFIFSTELHQ